MDGRQVPFVLHKSYGGGNSGVSSVMGGHTDRALPFLYPHPYTPSHLPALPSLGHHFHTLESVEAACRLPLQLLAQQQQQQLHNPFQQPSMVPQNALGLLPLPHSLQPKNESAEKPATIVHATAAQEGEPGRGKKRRRLSKHSRLALQNETHNEIVPATIVQATAAQGEPGRGKKRRRLSKHSRLALQNETHNEIVELGKSKKTYKCLACDIILNSRVIMQYHLFSNRHRNQMRKKKNKKLYRNEKKTRQNAP